MMSYDEGALVQRLAALSQAEKTAFAAVCAERLMPAYSRYVAAGGEGDLTVLTRIVERVWNVVAGAQDDLSDAQVTADSMIPDDDAPGWVPERAYGQNGAAAVAYAVDAWLTDDPQEAAWAARQVFDAAEYAAREPSQGLEISEPGVEEPSLASPVVQIALATIESDLSEIERSGTSDLEALRQRAQGEAVDWVALFP